jgi:hypothetical protein
MNYTFDLVAAQRLAMNGERWSKWRLRGTVTMTGSSARSIEDGSGTTPHPTPDQLSMHVLLEVEDAIDQVPVLREAVTVIWMVCAMGDDCWGQRQSSAAAPSRVNAFHEDQTTRLCAVRLQRLVGK